MANNKAKGPSLPASHSPPWPDSTRPSPAHEPVAEPWPDRLPEAASPARPVLSLPCQAHVFTPSLGRAGLTSQPLALQLPTSEPPEQGTGQKGQGPDTPGPQALPTLTEPLSVNWERLRNQPPRAGDRVKHHSPTNRTCWQLPGVPHSKAPARRHAGPDAYPHQWCAHSDKRFSSAPICPAGEGGSLHWTGKIDCCLLVRDSWPREEGTLPCRHRGLHQGQDGPPEGSEAGFVVSGSVLIPAMFPWRM